MKKKKEQELTRKLRPKEIVYVVHMNWYTCTCILIASKNKKKH